MPTPQLKALHEKTGTSMADLERYWSEAKKQAEGKFKVRDGKYWAYVYGIVSNRAHVSGSNKQPQRSTSRFDVNREYNVRE
jgi:hypothetical protein